ncbi:MAG: DUF4190 domain-containing protein [Anaerolineaceae bacterium]|nr:DUF4190 domain-containing protein [Anaerolineaceae bacterium]
MSYQNNVIIQKTTSVLAILSTISGVASFFVVPFVGAIAALITGYLAKKEIKNSNGSMDGEGFATAGIVMGWINLGISFMACLLIFAIIILFGLFTFRAIR